VTDAKTHRARQRLRQELHDDTGVEDLAPIEVEELVFACRPPVHERHAPPYGAIVTTRASQKRRKRTASSTPAPLVPFDRTDVRIASVDDARRFADGRSSFVVRVQGRDPRLRVFAHTIGDELTLTRLADAGTSVIQRTGDGRVRLFRKTRIYTREWGRWWSKPTATTYLGPVLQHLGEERGNTAQALLELCVHHLSPANVGSTLVWNLASHPPGHLDNSVVLRPPEGFAVTQREFHPVLRAVLAQLDRAALLDPEGQLVALNVLLDVPPPTSPTTDGWGTRHHSAQSFSDKQPKSVVFTVSQDGPVTVFYRGEAIATTEKAKWIEADWSDCPRCQPPLRERRDFDAEGNEWPEDDETDEAEPALFPVDPACPVCGGKGIVAYEFSYTGPYE
jgi:hypothetical protein